MGKKQVDENYKHSKNRAMFTMSAQHKNNPIQLRVHSRYLHLLRMQAAKDAISALHMLPIMFIYQLDSEETTVGQTRSVCKVTRGRRLVKCDQIHCEANLR